MRSKWIPAGLVVVMLAAAITGGAVLASGGDENVNGDPDAEETVVVVEDGDYSVQSIANDDVDATGEPDDLFVRVAEILGADAQATHDAMVRADQVDLDLDNPGVDGQVEVGDEDSQSVHAEGTSYLEYGNKIGEILGIDGETVARAIAQAYEELYAVVRDISDNGSGRDVDGKYDSEKNPSEPDG